MEGKQFGVGMVAGLLVALAVVALSGITPAPTASPVSTTLSNGSSPYGTQSVTTNTGAVLAVTTTGTSPVPPSTSNLSNSTGNSATTGNNGEKAVSAFTSSISGIDHLSWLYRVLVVAPIAAAVLLGALLYRLSGRSQRSAEPQ